MPRILFLTLDTFRRTGGIQQFNRVFSLALSQLAAQKGWEARHYSLWDENSPDERYQPPADFRGFGRRRLAFFRAVCQALRRTDMVVLGHANLAMVAWLGRWLAPRTRFALMAHGYEMWRPLRGMGGRALPHVHACWCVSQFTAKQVAAAGQIPPARIHLLHNALDPFFAAASAQEGLAHLQQRLRLDTRRPMMLTVARLSRSEQPKGYDTLLELMPELCRRIPGLCYVLAGRYDPDEYHRLQEKAEALGLRGHLVMPGFVPAAELPALYQLCPVFVMPSQKEGFGIVFVEAAWCGCRVVATAEGGSAEALLQGSLGALVPAGNDGEPFNKQLVSNIEKAFANPTSEAEKQHFRNLIHQYFGFDTFKHTQAALVKGLLNP